MTRMVVKILLENVDEWLAENVSLTYDDVCYFRVNRTNIYYQSTGLGVYLLNS